MRRAHNFSVVAGLCGILLASAPPAGCSLFAGAEPAARADVIYVEPAARVAPARRASVDIQVRRGDDIGSLEGGTPCLPDEDLIQGKDRAADDTTALIPISSLAASQQPIAERLAAVNANVVTIVAGENGGAGFFIDKGRHVLTAAIAVGRTPRVMVVLGDGPMKTRSA